MSSPIITLCKQAKAELKYLHRVLNNRPIIIGVKKGGCKTFKYFIEPANTNNHTSLEFNYFDINTCNESNKYINGTKISFIRSTLGSRFYFENPNASSHCCCGKSFDI